MFSSRSCLLNPRSLQRWFRITSPSITSTWSPWARSSVATARQIVVLPAPLRPVNHTVRPCCCATREPAADSSNAITGPTRGRLHDHSRANGVVVERIDDDEAASDAIALIRIAEDRIMQIDLYLADFVELQAVCFQLLQAC